MDRDWGTHQSGPGTEGVYLSPGRDRHDRGQSVHGHERSLKASADARGFLTKVSASVW